MPNVLSRFQASSLMGGPNLIYLRNVNKTNLTTLSLFLLPSNTRKTSV